jgi:hypothetical protein
MLMIWTAEPGSKSAEALSLLGSWGATPQQSELHDAASHQRGDHVLLGRNSWFGLHARLAG